MSGWVTPTSPGTTGGPIAWETPDPSPGLSVGQLLREAWGLYRGSGRRLLLVAAVPGLIQAVLSAPSVAIAVTEVQAVLGMFAHLGRFRTDPVAFQAEFQAALRPPTELLVLGGVTGGIGIAFLIIGWAALTSAALDAAEGRPVLVGAAFRTVFARSTSIVIPALVVGGVWAVATAIETTATPSGRLILTPSQSALYGLFGILLGIISLGAFVLAIVWSLALPAILVEDPGLRRGLARGAGLTRGMRFRLGLAFVVVWILQGLSIGVTAAVIAIVGGVLARSVEVGVVLYFAILLIGGVLWMPFLPAMLAVAYRDRTNSEDGEDAAATGASAASSAIAPTG